MISHYFGVKWEKSESLISLPDLALRWSLDAPLKIAISIHNDGLKLYEWKEGSKDIHGEVINKILLLEKTKQYGELVQLMPHIVFRMEEVGAIEKERPEYTITSTDKGNNVSLRNATAKNLPLVVPNTLFAITNYKEYQSKFFDEIFCADVGVELCVVDKIFEEANLEPLAENFLCSPIGVPQKKTPLTTFELAQQFIAKCQVKSQADRYLAVIELDKRFPALTRREIGELLPANPGAAIEPESAEKQCDRLRSATYKYRDLE